MSDCPNCADHKTRFKALLIDYENLQVDNAAKLRRIKTLESEKAKQREETPAHSEARELFDFWVERCHKDPKRTKFGKRREKAVLDRLKDGYTKKELATAIAGAAVGAYRDPKGVVHNDLALICRDEVMVDKNIARYEAYQANTLPQRMVAA